MTFTYIAHFTPPIFITSYQKVNPNVVKHSIFIQALTPLQPAIPRLLQSLLHVWPVGLHIWLRVGGHSLGVDVAALARWVADCARLS